MSKTLYLAGPMSGIPQFNYPAFKEATKVLREHGWDVISPVELDPPEVQKASLKNKTGKSKKGKVGGKSWGDLLAKDVKIVADCVDGIVFLPDWQKSRGAKLEAVVAILCDLGFYEYDKQEGAIEVPVSHVKDMLAYHL